MESAKPIIRIETREVQMELTTGRGGMVEESYRRVGVDDLRRRLTSQAESLASSTIPMLPTSNQFPQRPLRDPYTPANSSSSQV
jgi:hypothetical protein